MPPADSAGGRQRPEIKLPEDLKKRDAKELLLWAAEQIGAVCPDSPRLDAEVLLAHVLGRDRLWLHLHPDFHLSEEEIKQFVELVARRCRQEPVAYITGRCEFYSRWFNCDSRALIPRPETELIVDEALSWTERRQQDSGEVLKILDLGTGSGMLAITLCLELEADFVVGSDISFRALTLARENCLFHCCDSRVHLICSSWFSALKPGAHFNLIVSNPPYVGEAERHLLPESVVSYEPECALFDRTESGLGALEHIFQMAPSYLNSPGLLLCETGWSQAKRIKDFAEGLGVWKRVYVIKDLAGHERVVGAEI